ncbi:MAG: hypothetical protein J6S67_13615 [Methanobrevibacter sp.]|nr:hypothetical protein [Methanobrevibacter sp.]
MKIGNLDISSIKVGSIDVDAVYLGTDLVYSGGTTPPTPSGSCISEAEGTWVSLDENFDQTTFPLAIYQLNFGAFNSMSCYYNCQFQTGLDFYDANNNHIGHVQLDYDFDSQSGSLTVWGSGTQIYASSDVFSNVNVCTLFGGAVYIQDVPSVENCQMMDCLEYECYEWDEETGECIDQGPCMQEECVMSETFYPLSVLIENNS